MEFRILPHRHHLQSERILDHMPKPEAFAGAAEMLKLMSDYTRIRLFWLLCHCEECVLTSRRDGKEVYYQAADTPAANALHLIIEQMAAISCPEEKVPQAGIQNVRGEKE